MGTTEAVGLNPAERVRQILRDAAQGSASDHGGLGAFWELPVDRLLEARLMGMPLIAPAEPEELAASSSCCAGKPKRAPRSARSALVLGLRGEPPFDGSQYPRLPWGGRPVPAEDARFVAEWIDEGCPTGTVVSYEVAGSPAAPVSVSAEPGSRAELARSERQVFDLYPGSANEYKYERGELKQRVNLDFMSEVQLDKLRFAFRELYELNKWPEDARNYNNLALIHQNHCQHGWERFLPWHRIYLYEFEQALQDHCPDVTLPYWDFTMARYSPARPNEGEVIPRALKAFLSAASFPFLAACGIPVDGIRDLRDVPFATLSDFFAAVTARIGEEYAEGEHRKRFIDALLDANSLWYPLRYPGQFGESTINKVIHYHYPTANDIEQILNLRTFRDFGGGSLYNDSFGFLDQNPHNTMHIWTGGINPRFGAGTRVPADRNRGVQVAGRRFHKRDDLYGEPQYGDMFSNLTASYDPVFWPIHVNVDRLWWEWQQRHPDSLPADLDSVLTPWSYTTRDTLDMHRFGYEYVKSTYIVPVGLGAPVGRFASRPAPVPEAFSSAEIRLHRVPQLPRSCFIRVFLNLPDASADTPLDDPRYAGYLAVFGHGSCYGGPGHCDLPPAQSRRYDLRPRSHNTPRNHRVDVTACMRRLAESGARDVQVTLVVIGADYEEDNELLRLEGVSINFLD